MKDKVITVYGHKGQGKTAETYRGFLMPELRKSMKKPKQSKLRRILSLFSKLHR